MALRVRLLREWPLPWTPVAFVSGCQEEEAGLARASYSLIVLPHPLRALMYLPD